MAYKRYIHKNGKKMGPYYYKSVRGPNGKIRSVYIGKEPPKKLKFDYSKFIPLIVLLVAFLVVILVARQAGVTGFLVAEQNWTQDWEHSLELYADSSKETIKAHIFFDQYKPINCSDSIIVIASKDNQQYIVPFELTEETYEEENCSEASIGFYNIIYEEPLDIEVEKALEITEGYEENTTYHIYYGEKSPSAKESLESLLPAYEIPAPAEVPEAEEIALEEVPEEIPEEEAVEEEVPEAERVAVEEIPEVVPEEIPEEVIPAEVSFSSSFEEVRENDSSLLNGFYVKNGDTYDIEVGNDLDYWEWYWSPVSTDSYSGGYSLFYDVTKNNELIEEEGETTFIKSDVFNIERKKYRLTFYTKPVLTYVSKRPANSMEVDFVTLTEDDSWEKYWYLAWNNDEIVFYWEGEIPVTPVFEDAGNGWKKITVDMDLSALPSNITKATIYFGSSSVYNYEGYALIDDVSLSEIGGNT